MTDISQMTDEILENIVSQMSASELLAIGDVYSALSEHLINEVIDIWLEENYEEGEEE